MYVDKTDMLAKLALNEEDAQYFIARPRRFGKSLMLSTLKCMFEGRKELFRGLKIIRRSGTSPCRGSNAKTLRRNDDTGQSDDAEGLKRSANGNA